MRKLAVLSICIALVFCVSFTMSAVASDEEDALQVFTKWDQALNESDGELMASVYWNSPETSMFGPVAAEAFLFQGYDSVIGSYYYLSKLPPGSYMITSHNAQATMLGNNIAVLTRYLTGTYTDPGTKEQEVGSARQTFVVQKIGGKWVIVHDHGSWLPTE